MAADWEPRRMPSRPPPPRGEVNPPRSLPAAPPAPKPPARTRTPPLPPSPTSTPHRRRRRRYPSLSEERFDAVFSECKIGGGGGEGWGKGERGRQRCTSVMCVRNQCRRRAKGVVRDARDVAEKALHVKAKRVHFGHAGRAELWRSLDSSKKRSRSSAPSRSSTMNYHGEASTTGTVKPTDLAHSISSSHPCLYVSSPQAKDAPVYTRPFPMNL